MKADMIKRQKARKQKLLEEQYNKQRAEMGMPDPDDYKSHNSSEDEDRSSPNVSKMEPQPQVAQTPVS